MAAPVGIEKGARGTLQPLAPRATLGDAAYEDGSTIISKQEAPGAWSPPGPMANIAIC